MDGLSAAGSIVALVQLTWKLAGYINDTRHATTDQKRVAVEASNLYSLLTNLRYRAETAKSDDLWLQQLKRLSIKDGPLDQFKDVLEQMVTKITSQNKIDQVKSALKWKFTKSEVETALCQMERLKSLIQCALAGDAFVLSKAIHNNVVTLGERLEQVSIGVEQLHKHNDYELLKRLADWLRVPDPSVNYHAALKKRHPNTGLWLVNGAHFKQWRDSNSSLMWLHGDAGCGKTVLSAAALQAILQYQESRPDVAVAYFYFDFNDAEKQFSRNAFRSLLLQFSHQVPYILQALKQLHEKSAQGEQQPHEEAVHSLLQDGLSHIDSSYIVLDALDECTDVEELATRLHDVIEPKPSGIHILAASRHEKEIQDQLAAVADYNINVQKAVVDEDIRLYIQDRLTTDPKLKKWPESVQKEIATVMMEKADGMFRWAYCQLESIRRCLKLKALREALSSLPKTLDETYERILQGLDARGHLPDSITVLRWLCYSERPLTLSELVEILAIETGPNGGFSPSERLPDPTDLMEICSSLVNCDALSHGTSITNHDGRDDDGDSKDSQGGSDAEKDSMRDYVRLAHFSVKEYLLSDRCAFRSDFQTVLCQQQIVEACLHYELHLNNLMSSEGAALSLPFDDYDLFILRDSYPLAHYVGYNLWHHARRIDGRLGGAVLGLVSALLVHGNGMFFAWEGLYLHDRYSWALQWLRPSNQGEAKQPLFYAAFTGISEIVLEFSQLGYDIKTSGFSGSPLAKASAHGHEEVVKILLSAGSNANCGRVLLDALHRASDGPFENIMELLLNAGAQVSYRGEDSDFRTALSGAASGGNEVVEQILFDVVAGATFVERYLATNCPLIAASHNGHTQIVRLLLKAGADVNFCRELSPALEVAFRREHLDVVQILSEAGAEVKYDDSFHWLLNSALRSAASHGYYAEMIQTLSTWERKPDLFALQSSWKLGHGEIFGC